MPHPIYRRGIAALVILCALPKLSATVLTVSQTATFSVAAATTGNGVGTSVSWHIPTFDPALGVLESVTWHASAVVDVSASDVNAYDRWPDPGLAREFTPYTKLEFTAYMFGLGGAMLTDSDFSEGTRRLVQPMETFSHRHVHSVSLEHTTTDPEDLARYSGLLPPLDQAGFGNMFLVRGEGYGRYGGISITGTLEATIAYTYRIDDGGCAIALFAATLIGLLAVRRRACGA